MNHQRPVGEEDVRIKKTNSGEKSQVETIQKEEVQNVKTSENGSNKLQGSLSSTIPIANYTHFEQLSPIQRIQVFIWEIFNIVKNLNLLKQWINYSLGISNNHHERGQFSSLENSRQNSAPQALEHLPSATNRFDTNSK